jgi:DNA-binding NarL/FixJ family response regulator
VAFSGRCLVHRAEILQLEGSMREALEEAIRAVERCRSAGNEVAAGEACYRCGEIHRVLGELDAAEEAYRDASRHGREPQPGLALLRLAQGRTDAAEAAIRRVTAETAVAGRRAAVLPAAVEIMLAVGDLGAAREACGELGQIAEDDPGGADAAMAMQARGALALAEDDAAAALAATRSAAQGWQELDAPYEAARVHVLVGLACRALGDDDSAALELDAARAVFAELGATPDLARVDELIGRSGTADTHGLSARELEVLRLVATGKTNREIAEALVVSQHTVARHVQNICRKLGVSSRTAATAFAFEHQLV